MSKASVLTGVGLVALTPLVFAGIKLYGLHRRVTANTVRSGGRCDLEPNPPSPPISLPASVASDPESWIIQYERVVSSPMRPPQSTHFIPSPQFQGSGLLQSYARAAHSAFSRTPQAFTLRMLIKDAYAKSTFSSTDHIQKLAFKVGDRVNGVYMVAYVGEGNEPDSERVELALDRPQGYSGATPRGRIIAEVIRVPGHGIGEEDEQVLFVNETWMWRKPEETKTLLEGGMGAWIHSLTSGWLLLEGIKAVIVA